MSAIKTSVSMGSPSGFNPEMVHPASIMTPAQGLAVSEQVFDRALDLEAIHPASIPSTPRLIKDGYGELILRVKEGHTLRPVNKDEYAKAYQIFQRYAPRLEEVPRPLEKSRIEMMREELRAINPNMVGTFIPRSLYELIFIRKSIEEDIQKEKEIPYEDRENPTFFEREAFTFSPTKNSWCSCGEVMRFVGDGVHFPKPLMVVRPEDVEKRIDVIVDIGYRLNIAACEILQRKAPNQEHLRLDTIQEIVQDHIQFLADFYKNPRSYLFVSMSEPMLTLSANFSEAARERGLLKPMAVSSEKIARLIRSAALLECQDSVINKIIMYRGGDIVNDSPMKNGKPYCISFGSSSFAGCVTDPGACAFHYSRDRNGYALVIDPTKESAHFFRIPPYTALESLFGRGEAWHYRFKVSDQEGEITGVDGGIGLSGDPRDKDIFKSPLSRQQLIEKFEDLKRHNLVVLKPPG